jgi:tRNA1Val (adenine37-N6)-methyltransferase
MSIFRFKRFTICDDQASMKLGTDAVLLGAWANVQDANYALDIGTGCGIIAIMLAQRTSATRIDAVELQAPDAEQAQENVLRSPWSNRISIWQHDVRTFETKIRYDVIVSNPPYFSRSLLPPKSARSHVRHDLMLNADDLVQSVLRLLSPAGKFSVILPPGEASIFISRANATGLVLLRHTKFFTRSSKPQERSLMEFGFTGAGPVEETLLLLDENERTTGEYQRLTNAFYLDRTE